VLENAAESPASSRMHRRVQLIQFARFVRKNFSDTLYPIFTSVAPQHL
jgi:hypothetical protein